MARIYVGPTTLHALGRIGELELLGSLDGRLVVPDDVAGAVTADPARTALAEFRDDRDVSRSVPDAAYDRATELLGVEAGTPEAAILAGVLAHADPDDRRAVAVVSDDRRVRRLTRGLGGTVTGSFGVVVRAAAEDKYLSRTQAKRIVRRLDGQGTRMTGEMRERVLGEM